jgi:hypothetical protein
MMKNVNEIVRSKRPDVVRLVLSFDEITSQIITQSESEIEVLRALHDQDGVVKEQIKMETLKHARAILQHCFQLVTGRRDWNE